MLLLEEELIHSLNRVLHFVLLGFDYEALYISWCRDVERKTGVSCESEGLCGSWRDLDEKERTDKYEVVWRSITIFNHSFAIRCHISHGTDTAP